MPAGLSPGQAAPEGTAEAGTAGPELLADDSTTSPLTDTQGTQGDKGRD